MKKLFTTFLLLFSILTSQVAYSWFALEATQWINRIQLIAQTLDHIEQAVNDFTTDGYRDEDMFDNLTGIVDELAQVTYAAEDIEGKFIEQYPGYEEYALTATEEFKDIALYRERYKKWRTETRTNAINSWERMSVMHEKLKDQEAAGSLATIQELAGTENRNQLIKANGALTAQMINQIQNLRQMLFDDMQMKNSSIMQEEEEQAYAQAETEWFLGVGEGMLPTHDEFVLDDGEGQY